MIAFHFFWVAPPSGEFDVMLREAASLVDKFNSTIPDGNYDIVAADGSLSDDPASTVHKDSKEWLLNRKVGIPCRGSYILFHPKNFAGSLSRMATWPGNISPILYLASTLYHELIHVTRHEDSDTNLREDEKEAYRLQRGFVQRASRTPKERHHLCASIAATEKWATTDENIQSILEGAR